ncbi:MAG: hypothetical protein ACMXYG_03455 [Candidatus Woesearchaeota archaeon]
MIDVLKFFREYKKSQVSLFLILSIVALIILIFFFLLSSTSKEMDTGFNDVDVDLPIRACIELELENALYIASLQGGYVASDFAAFVANFVSGVPYWLYNGIYTAPSNDFIANEIKNFLDNRLTDCIKGVILQEIEIEKISSNIIIYYDRVIAEVDIRGDLSLGDQAKRLGRYRVAKEVMLGEMLMQARDSIFQIMDSNAIPLTFLARQKYLSEIITRPEGFVLKITDDTHLIKGENYSLHVGFSFALPDNLPPTLYEEGPFFGYVHEELYIEYDAEDDAYEDQLRFSMVTLETYNDMDIDPITGVISYYPTVAKVHTAFVTVTDAEGLTDTKFLYVEVRER